MKRNNPKPSVAETVAPDYWERLAEHQRTVLFSPEQRDILAARQQAADESAPPPLMTSDAVGELLFNELMGAR